MHEPDFNRLKTELLQSGVASSHTQRTVRELQEHYRDLVDDEVRHGASNHDARRVATAKLGKMDEVLERMQACRAFQSWAFRYPRIALVFYPLACLAMLPAIPVVAGVANAPLLARWGASLLLAGMFTATMLLILQLLIIFG